MLHDLLEDHLDKLGESMTADNLPVEEYVRRFQWDIRKYSVKNSTRDLVDDIVAKVTEVENELKAKQLHYTTVKNALNGIERGNQGTLLARNLVNVVNAEDVIVGSEHLQSVIVCVPTSASREWQESYEKLTDMVVPKSGRKIIEEQDYELWSVTLFRRVAEDFKNAAREKKFIVRDFEFDPHAKQNAAKTRKTMEMELKKQWSGLVRWGKTYFSECFTSWMHIKAIRLFVESVLRYGLPANFQGMLLSPHKKKDKQLRTSLEDLYQHLENRSGQDSKGANNEDDAPAGLGVGDYYPYVYIGFSLGFIEKAKN
ncbi:hypothetical protein SARC_12894 [Sphaeroforma arctica JP610]|uniref:V-type proton ATPase subunit C n=1 Tax=Sphaeroforma arctica JP610 TaxID=667725 RepID=A0A0L0FCU0_9EUKA|nr:hypothetical protein SARC_12894 [Sphaeroforma arctica JP610]KNC74564.1 hypothetical protein SARC_12894 [Sphaeroforma arctica JP610]|eukprot:XP_014148466.1 hypothetical protein SARC_12894 [Sphaeroforma arctica JP610]